CFLIGFFWLVFFGFFVLSFCGFFVLCFVLVLIIRFEAINRQLSLPRLENVDWRIDLKTASDQRGRMSIPTLIVNLGVETLPDNVKEEVGKKNINFELGKEGLEILLEGLREIKSQLDAIQG